jgi:heptosyltransferase-2
MRKSLKNTLFNLLFFLLRRKSEKPLSVSSIRKILVIGYMGIGNMILFSPVLAALREKYSAAKITVLSGDNGCIEVVSQSPLIDHILLFNFNRCSITTYIRMLLRIRQGQYDLLIANFNSIKNYIPHFILFAGTRFQLIHDIHNMQYHWFYQKITHPVPYYCGMHEMEQNLNLVKPLGEMRTTHRPLFFISSNDSRFATEWLRQNGLSHFKKIVALQPGSYSQMSWKRWPIDHYIKLANSLIQKLHVQIVILGSAEERGLAEDIRRRLKTRISILCGEATLKQAAAVLALCHCLVCNDSGIMHIGTAVDIPVVALFGPTDPRRTSPICSNVRILRNPVACSPCFFGFDSQKPELCKNRICMNGIFPETVFSVVKELLS